MILVIDNYDSFTYNLVQHIGELGAEPVVHRNDALTPGDIRRLAPRGVIISPGPGTPDDAGVSVAAIQQLSGELPILGVCLGHQSIGAAFGGVVGRATPLHGKSSLVHHEGDGLFEGLPSPFRAGRYHSLVVFEEGLPAALKVTARTADGTIMGLRHASHPTFGVQFHPESILTVEGSAHHGKAILRRFLERCGEVPR